jgi:multicomponent K+:H+ antiporter subunit D
LIPLVAGGLLLLTGRAGRGVERSISLAATSAFLVVAILLLERTAGGELLTYYAGNCWSQTA